MTRAVVATAYGGPEVLELVEHDPGMPGPGQVRLRVRAAGVNPADWKWYSGKFGTDPDRLPLPLGFEAAGVVSVAGEGSRFAPGDEVIAQPVTGAYSHRLVVDDDALLPKPAAMSWETAAGIMVAGVTAAHALHAVRVGAGDTLLVHGAAGGVGAMLVQLARVAGVRVIGTASPRNHEFLVDLGTTPIAYGPGLADRVRRAAGGRIDAAIDTAGTAEALECSVALVPNKKRVATVAGHALGARLGVLLLGAGPGADPGTEVRLAARAQLLALWEAGRLDVRIGSTYPLADAAAAHDAIRHGHTPGKIVLTM